MKWVKASTFLHGKAKRAAEKGKEAAWQVAWQGYLQDVRNGKQKIAEGRHEGDRKTGLFQLRKGYEMVKGCVEGLSSKPALHMCMCPLYGKQYLSSPCYHLSPGLLVGPAREKEVFTRTWEVVDLRPILRNTWQEVRILTTGPRLPCLICDMSGDGPIGPIDPRGPGCPGGPGDPGTPWLPFGPGAPAIDSKGYLPGKAFRTLHQCKQWGLTIFGTTQWIP